MHVVCGICIPRIFFYFWVLRAAFHRAPLSLWWGIWTPQGWSSHSCDCWNPLRIRVWVPAAVEVLTGLLAGFQTRLCHGDTAVGWEWYWLECSLGRRLVTRVLGASFSSPVKWRQQFSSWVPSEVTIEVQWGNIWANTVISQVLWEWQLLGRTELSARTEGLRRPYAFIHLS